MTPEPDDDDLAMVKDARSGSQSACAALVQRYERPVFNLIVHIVRNPGVAEELAQETFLKAFRFLHTFEARYRFRNWLFRIAHNTAIDHLRHPAVSTVLLDESGAAGEPRTIPAGHQRASGPDPTAGLDQEELARAVESALDTLRPELRRLVVLRYQEDLSMEDIAGITGLPVGTVKSHLHRARARLAELLREQAPGRGDGTGSTGTGGGATRRTGRP